MTVRVIKVYKTLHNTLFLLSSTSGKLKLSCKRIVCLNSRRAVLHFHLTQNKGLKSKQLTRLHMNGSKRVNSKQEMRLQPVKSYSLTLNQSRADIREFEKVVIIMDSLCFACIMIMIKSFCLHRLFHL